MAYTTIDDPSAHFQTKIWTGNDTSQSITNDGNSNLKPDWIWAKKRSASDAHNLVDTSRGLTNYIFSNVSNGDTTDSSKVQSMDLNGFSVGASNSWNDNNVTYVAWQWKANGGTTTTNDASATSVGTIDSVYQANTTAGFSIVTYTGSGSEGTIAHGLGVTPKMIIWKRRTDDGNNWSVQGKQSPINTDRVEINLNSTGAKSSVDSRIGRQSQWSSTVFEVNTYVDQNTSSKNYVAYCFAEKQGYSKFGSYEANDNTDGPFIYTGFKPAWVILKCVDSTGNWFLFDNKRDNSNMVTQTIYGDLNAAENTESNGLDFLSNGIKLRQSGSGGINHSGTYIYMAFAEHPFVSSKGVPVTAR
jgi:hypothetical protein